MARQIVDIGLEGNDNTGDSIRESFRKVNENFNEIYAVFGLGGKISITDMDDVPEYGNGSADTILAVNRTANGINFTQLESDGSIGFEYVEDLSNPANPTYKLIVKQLTSKLLNDKEPQLDGPLNARSNPIANIADVSEDAVARYNSAYSNNQITIDQLVIDKKYADMNYLPKTIPGGGTRLRNEPLTVNEYTKSFLTSNINVANRTITITGHGLNFAYNGAPFVFNSANAPLGLNPETVYYVKIIDSNTIALHTTQNSAIADQNRTIDITTRLQMSRTGSGTHTLTDAAYNDTLIGNWLSNEALPRKSVVRRQGDRMEGPLYLYDHPGDLAGNDYENLDDLQAATKLYVDNVSTASQLNLFVKTDGDDSQASSPFGKEGRSQAYAFKTIGAAAKLAEELIMSSPVEPGPYMQTITHTNKTVNSLVHSVSFTNASVPTRVNARNIILQNKKFLQKEATLYIKNTYPQFEFNVETCERDIEIILEAITLDIISGNNANLLSRTAAIRYFSSPIAKRSVTTYRTQTLAVHEFLKDTILTYILPSVTKANPYQGLYLQVVNPSLAIDGLAGNTVASKFDVIKNIIENGIFVGGVVDGQNSYKIYITNNNGFVDQGISTNSDLIPGKLVRGKTSRALGKIISYTREADTSIVPGTDQLELQLVEPAEFIQGEELEFGSVAQTTQITINVESGIYHEDYPIRIAPNVSINGDEFRRVIIRPKNRISQSSYAETFFYRDKEFDGLDLFADKLVYQKGIEYVNPLTSEVDGYFGYHYLKDSSARLDTGPTYDNYGNWTTAYRSVMQNKDFIVEQSIKYFEAVNDLIASTYEKPGLKRYLQQSVDAIAKDLLVGGNETALEMQGNLWQYAVTQGISSAAMGAVNFAKDLIKLICDATAPSTYHGIDLEFPASRWPDLSLGSSDPALWIPEKQYLRNSVIKIPFGASFEYYRSRVVHTSTTNFATDKNLYWIKISGIDTTVDNLSATILYPYAEPALFNPPKHNKDMDVFLMNDSTILRNITVQGHGGFMCVLDPQGQVLNKSPYIQTGSSFSQSINKQAFRGGMFIDGFVGNLAMNVISKVNNDPFRVSVQSSGSTLNPEGLFIRRPETPCSFYIQGHRYQVNAVANYDQTTGTAELILDKGSNDGVGFVESSLPFAIVLQTAGNRSMLGNDFTQINDLGYGLVCVNGALSEMVSMFTYYCRAGYYSKNGSEIRSLTGSTCYGQYGLVAEGADPNEIPDDIALVHDMIQPARIFEAENILYLDVPVTASRGDTIQQNRTVGGQNLVITATVVTDIANSSVVYIKNLQGGSFDTINTIENLDTSNWGGTLPDLITPIAYNIDAEPYLNTLNSLSMYVFDMKDVPVSNSELDIYHPVRNIVGKYQVRNVVKTEAVVGKYKEVNNMIPTEAGLGGIGGTNAKFSIQKTKFAGYSVAIDAAGTGYSAGNQFIVRGTYLGGATPSNDATITVNEVTPTGGIARATIAGTIFPDENTPQFSGQVYRLNFSRSDAQFSTLGILEEVNWYTDDVPTTIEYRRNEDHIINGIGNPSTLTIRPSTALVFDEYENYVYRTISFTQQDSIGNELPVDSVQVSFDSSYDYIKLNIDSVYKDATDTLNPGKTLGSTVGDVNIAIRPITEPSAILRLANNPKMIFSWKGAKYQVYNYRTVPAVSEEPLYAIVSITKVSDIVNTGTGLSVPFNLPIDQTTIKAGLAATSAGNITFNISTCRATGHDFLDVGNGGYNETNYPNVIFGQSTNNTNEGNNEVNEVGKGRVFYVSTDQNGVFRVGRFFTVDQGTGTVSFAASIALSDIDGIGFKRGVTVNEFSTDTALSDNDENTVPVESAVRGHVNRRLGFNSDGRLISNTIGPGVMSLGGDNYEQTPMRANMSLGGYKITNLNKPLPGNAQDRGPTDNYDAAHKKYVDEQIASINGLDKLDGVTLTATPPAASVLAFTGTVQNTVNAAFAGDVTLSLNANTLTSTISANAINNAKVSTTAGIVQSKLSMNKADTFVESSGWTGSKTQADLGLAKFSANNFETADGFVRIKDNGIAVAELAQVASGTVLGRISTGTGNVSAVSIEDVLAAVGGIIDDDFTTTAAIDGVALVRTATSPAAAYAVTNISKTGQANSLVKTDADGKIQVKSVILGGDASYEILSLNGTTTVLKTPAQGTILSSSGTGSPLVTLPGSVVIGTGNADRSTLQANAGAAINNTSRLKVDWIHTSFIEASGEKDASSTGVAIGASTGRTNEGEVGIVTARISNNTSVMAFKFSSTGVVPDVSLAYDIGSETKQYKNVWAETFNGTATSAYYADLAENYLADAEYEAGTVLVFGGTNEVTISGDKGTHRVAGVVSTNPAHLMNSMLKGDHVVALALQGRVPVKVVGTVKKGDLLVNSGIAGYACVDNNAKAGCILGKSLEDKNDANKGIVEAVVGKH